MACTGALLYWRDSWLCGQETGSWEPMCLSWDLSGEHSSRLVPSALGTRRGLWHFLQIGCSQSLQWLLPAARVQGRVQLQMEGLLAATPQ